MMLDRVDWLEAKLLASKDHVESTLKKGLAAFKAKQVENDQKSAEKMEKYKYNIKTSSDAEKKALEDMNAALTAAMSPDAEPMMSIIEKMNDQLAAAQKETLAAGKAAEVGVTSVIHLASYLVYDNGEGKHFRAVLGEAFEEAMYEADNEELDPETVTYEQFCELDFGGNHAFILAAKAVRLTGATDATMVLWLNDVCNEEPNLVKHLLRYIDESVAFDDLSGM